MSLIRIIICLNSIKGLASRNRTEISAIRGTLTDTIVLWEARNNTLQAKLEALGPNGFDVYSSAHQELKREAELLKANFETMDSEAKNKNRNMNSIPKFNSIQGQNFLNFNASRFQHISFEDLRILIIF